MKVSEGGQVYAQRIIEEEARYGRLFNDGAPQAQGTGADPAAGSGADSDRGRAGRSRNRIWRISRAGHHPQPRPHLIEEFARALGIDRYVLYLAARTVPPEVAEQLARLTIEEREAAWARVHASDQRGRGGKESARPGARAKGAGARRQEGLRRGM